MSLFEQEETINFAFRNVSYFKTIKCIDKSRKLLIVYLGKGSEIVLSNNDASRFIEEYQNYEIKKSQLFKDYELGDLFFVGIK